MGRFTGVDPVMGELENPQRLNSYAYGLNSPYKYVDPDGGDPKSAQYIYRVDNLAKTTPEVSGFQADPNAHISIAQHIGEEMKPSQYISATTDPNNSNYEGTRYRIDVAELKASGGKILTTKQLLGYARNDPASLRKIKVDSEVLIKPNVPASAITKLGQVLGKAGRGLGVYGMVRSAIGIAQAIEVINNAPMGSTIYINPLTMEVTAVSKPD